MQHDFILLDRSGSMGSLWVEAIGSINAYVKKLAEDKVDTGVTLATFDQHVGSMSFDVVRDRIIPSTWKSVSPTEVEPRGGTPLNDATGRIVSLAKAGNYEKVAIIIMTDGMENASKEFSTAAIKALLDECRAKNWQVIFLGANFDNAQQAQSYGASASQTGSFGRGSMLKGMTATASSRVEYAKTGASMGFTDEQKEDLKKSRHGSA